MITLELEAMGVRWHRIQTISNMKINSNLFYCSLFWSSAILITYYWACGRGSRRCVGYVLCPKEHPFFLITYYRILLLLLLQAQALMLLMNRLHSGCCCCLAIFSRRRYLRYIWVVHLRRRWVLIPSTAISQTPTVASRTSRSEGSLVFLIVFVVMIAILHSLWGYAINNLSAYGVRPQVERHWYRFYLTVFTKGSL